MQGDWGEIELNRILEVAGLQKNIDYFTQENFKNENNQNLIEQIKNVDFAYDPNAFECIYTYDNIPPSAIEIVEEIEQQYLNNKR